MALVYGLDKLALRSSKALRSFMEICWTGREDINTLIRSNTVN